MNVKCFFFCNIFCLFSLFSQNELVTIDNADYNVVLKQVQKDSTGKSTMSYGITYEAKNIEINELFEFLVADNDIIRQENLSKTKYVVKIIFLHEGTEVKLKLLKELCATFKLGLNIEEKDDFQYRLNIVNMNLFSEERPQELPDGMDSMSTEDSLQAFVSVDKLVELLNSSTKDKYIGTDQKNIKEKYFFALDLKNIDASLSKAGLGRTSIPYKKNIFNFSVEKEK